MPTRWEHLHPRQVSPYYGLSHEDVRISPDQSKFSIIGKDGSSLVEAPLIEGQWLEVNWFSSWTNKLTEKELVREAKRAYGDQDITEYLRLVPEIIRLFLSRVDGLDVPSINSELPGVMEGLGGGTACKMGKPLN